jgi:hypothetical protein
MRRIIFSLVLLSFFKTYGQYDQGIFMHGSLSPIGILYDQAPLAINDFVINDRFNVSPFNYSFGGNVKLMQSGKNYTAGFSLGYNIGKSISDKSYAKMNSTKWNVGIVWYRRRGKGYQGVQATTFYSWGGRTYFFSGNNLLIPSSFQAALSNVSADHVFFNQKSVGVNCDFPVNPGTNSSRGRAQNSQAHYRLLIGMEYVLKSSKWILSNLAIPDYGGAGFFSVNCMLQIDFGKCIPHLIN